MPKLWLMYTSFLALQHKITLTRRTFDKALKCLPVSQHARIWKEYSPWAMTVGGETAIRVVRRFVKVC